MHIWAAPKSCRALSNALLATLHACFAAAEGGLGPAKQQPAASLQQAPPDAAPPPAAAEDPHAGFTVAVGNGLFWLLPYIMYWAASTTLHSGLFDNGRLDRDHAKCVMFLPLFRALLTSSADSSEHIECCRAGFACRVLRGLQIAAWNNQHLTSLPMCPRRWMFWGFFCAYLAVGAFFNLLLQMLCYQQHRFAVPARNVLLAQGLVASVLFYTATAPFPGLYVLLRYDSWPLAWFASAVFWLLCVYLTLVSLHSHSKSSRVACTGAWWLICLCAGQLPAVRCKDMCKLVCGSPLSLLGSLWLYAAPVHLHHGRQQRRLGQPRRPHRARSLRGAGAFTTIIYMQFVRKKCSKVDSDILTAKHLSQLQGCTASSQSL